jgi:hypothetical protein
VPQQLNPQRGRMRADRQSSGVNVRAAERGVQAHIFGGVQHPQRTRPNHPQPRAPQDLEQTPSTVQSRLAVVFCVGGQHQQRSRPACCGLGGDIDQLVTARSDDDKLRGDRQLHKAAGRKHRADHAAVTIDRPHNAPKTGPDDIREHRISDVPRHCLRTHHRDRGRLEERTQRRDSRDMVPLTDPLPHRLGRRDIQRHRDLTPRATTTHPEASVLKDAQHRPVLHQHLGIKTMDPPLGRDLRKLLEHPRPDPATLMLVGHRKRNLRHAPLT